jgi:RNA polymerase sigma-70 factor (sigma-E family)
VDVGLMADDAALGRHGARARAAGADFDAFFRANYGWAVRLAHVLVGDQATAEDVVQDAYAKVQPRFDQLENPGAFLRVTIVNTSRSHHRRRGREVARLRRVDATAGSIAPEARELLDAVDGLPHRQKVVIVLRYYEDLSEREIAEALGCRPGTVKSLAARALAALGKEIER